MKQKKFIFSAVAIAFFAMVFTACSDRIIGYSVVLWDIPEQGIISGDVLPVYIKSNISHVYIAGTEDGEKIEIPLWKMTEPVKKRKVQNVESKYHEYIRTYAHVKTDGLPCRAEPVNTAKQVYRFRKNEIIKVLYKGEGQAPMSGGEPLPGQWYRILTSDGTEGWCFSYSLNLFQLDDNGNPVNSEQIVMEEDVDEVFNNLTANTWYPESFRAMIDNKDFDLSLFNSAYKFVIDLENNKVILNTDEIHESWNYNGYKKLSHNEYDLNDMPVKVVARKEDFTVVRYTDSSGKPVDLTFITLGEEEDVDELVKEEKERRADEYNRILAQGPKFSSSTYGELSFTRDGTFKWTGFDLLVPSVIQSLEKTAGTVSVKYSVSKEIAKDYDGVLTFKFQGIKNEVNFFYKVEAGGLRLEDTTTALMEDDSHQFKERGNSPVIMYFKSSK